MLYQIEIDHHLQYTKKNLLRFHKIVVGFWWIVTIWVCEDFFIFIFWGGKIDYLGI